MKLTLIVRDQAVIDVDEAGKWYDEQREGLSVDFELCVEAGFDDILLQSEGYQFRYRGIVRVRYIKRFPYGIHYIVENRGEETRIFVIAVFHTSKDPNSWTERLDEL